MRGAPTGPVTSRPLVVGLGSPHRGDDAVGVVVARGVAACHVPGVDVVAHEDPTDLVELWSGHELAVVVDAVRSGSEPGTLTVLETGALGERLRESAWGRTGRGGTHAFGLASAVELARALRRLPDRVVLVGVEAASFDHGAPLSPAVAAAVPTAVDRVLAVVREASEGTTTPEGAARVPG
ncbi:hydrogenase maturation protease [Knoellia sp. p5-6-4]|uniref:hydrogenase maturation protease n=1 Tax=unclassified Knoellia TaxID=2618719 RepID=UPI0023DAD028|nr:hydrogenase maturation protease [Knoellia sp. p5-6-4]MDF2143460.1 hydrogenase maturation protease [Knoellia sp. p5-6-4]